MRIVEREVQLEDVDAGLAEQAELAAVGVLVDQREHRRPSRPAGLATRGAWSRALATEMCGSRPDADAVTASTGTSASAAQPFSCAVGARRARSTASSRSGLVGPRLEPELRRAVVSGAGRRRARVEVLRSRERLADQLAADDHAVALDQRAVGLVVERDLPDRR